MAPNIVLTLHISPVATDNQTPFSAFSYSTTKVASFLVATVTGAYLSVVYHMGMGPILWNSGFSPFNWLFTFAVFSGGFFWEFRRSRSK
jgi:hypothetical protein